ncbi:2581_t:CDS:2, partial [Gigaspora rosea]
KTIIQNWKATLGTTPDFERIPYLSSRITLSANFSKTDIPGSFSIEADYNVAVVETEI